MRQGFRVIDTDTHVHPSMDVLLRYADQALRECMDELKPYMRTVKPRPGQGDAEDQETATMLTKQAGDLFVWTHTYFTKCGKVQHGVFSFRKGTKHRFIFVQNDPTSGRKNSV